MNTLKAEEIMKEIDSQITGEKIETKGCFGSIIYDANDTECQSCQFNDTCAQLVAETGHQQMADIEAQLQLVQEAMHHEQQVEQQEQEASVLDQAVGKSSAELGKELSKRFAKKFRPMFEELMGDIIFNRPTEYKEMAAMVKKAVATTKYNPSYLMRQKILPALIEAQLVRWEGDKYSPIVWI